MARAHAPIRLAWWVTLAGMVACVWTPLAGGQAVKAPPRGTVARAVSELSAEAARSWDDRGDWPTLESDFARRAEYSLTGFEVLAALGRRLHEHPAMDAYIKWQLLSLTPDLEGARTHHYQNILHGLPAMVPAPTPQLPPRPGQQPGGLTLGMQRAAVVDSVPVPGTGARRPKLGVITSGVGMTAQGTIDPYDPRYVRVTAETVQTQLVEDRQRTFRLNEPALLYRDRVVGRMPLEGGVRPLAMVTDLRQRLDAGHPSTGKAAQRYLDLLTTMGVERVEEQVPEPMRRRLLGLTRQLLPLRTRVVTEVRVNDADAIELRSEEHAVPREMVLEMLRLLGDPAAGQSSDSSATAMPDSPATE